MTRALRRLIAGDPGAPFVAIDFETADCRPDSACAVALVRVDKQRIVDRRSALIRPPRRYFVFSYIHGITWNDVADAPTFAEFWPEVSDILAGVHFLAAHNSPFDRRVLAACCQRAGLAMPPQPFFCTVSLARSVWRLRPANLPAVCAHLQIPLRHHDAGSDAEACARIVIEATRHWEADRALGHDGFRTATR